MGGRILLALALLCHTAAPASLGNIFSALLSTSFIHGVVVCHRAAMVKSEG